MGNKGPPCYENIEQVHEVIVKDEILTEDCKQALLEYAADTNVHSELGLTFGETLRYVFSRIQSNPNANGIKEVLNKEMADSVGKCFTGRITRLIDCLNAFDPLVEINLLSEKELINNVCLRVYKLLKEEEEQEQTQTRQDKAKQTVLDYIMSFKRIFSLCQTETEEGRVANRVNVAKYRQQVEDELKQYGITIS